MQPDKTEQLNSIVAALTDYITVVRSFQLQETAVLLDMAKLDLQMKIHSISDRELQALCEALERQGAVTRGKRKSRALSNVAASSGAESMCATRSTAIPSLSVMRSQVWSVTGRPLRLPSRRSSM